MPHGRGRYPCKNGQGHYEFREHKLLLNAFLIHFHGANCTYSSDALATLNLHHLAVVALLNLHVGLG